MKHSAAELDQPNELVAHPGESNLVNAVGVDGTLAMASDVGILPGKPNLLEVHLGLAFLVEAGRIEVPQRRREITPSLVDGEGMERVLDFYTCQSATFLINSRSYANSDSLGLSLVV